MPLYEYACSNCGHQFEARQKISDAPITTCPKCHKDTVERLVSKTSFALKGSGWYADGYGAKSGAKGSEASTSSTPSSTESKSEPKTETPKADAPKADSGKTESKPKKDSGD